MWNTLIAGVFGLAGVLIGSSLSRLFDLAQARAKREHQLADARRLVYVDYLSNAHRFTSWAWTVDDDWQRPVPAASMAAHRERYDATWTEFVSSYAAVQVGGPDHVAARATELFNELSKFALFVESRTASESAESRVLR